LSAFPSHDKVDHITEKYKDISLDHWIHGDLFTWKWWLLLSSLIIPWIIWWKIVNKKRLKQILIYGLSFSSISILLDEIGTFFRLWTYPDKLLPVPSLFPADLSIIPVSFMLLYQYIPKGKAFFAGNVVLSGILAFILEPLFEKLHLFEIQLWKHTYTFVGLMAIAYFIRWGVEYVEKKSE
jgi:hypothetical protein